jgi:hypothetical protein
MIPARDQLERIPVEQTKRTPECEQMKRKHRKDHLKSISPREHLKKVLTMEWPTRIPGQQSKSKGYPVSITGEKNTCWRTGKMILAR